MGCMSCLFIYFYFGRKRGCMDGWSWIWRQDWFRWAMKNLDLGQLRSVYLNKMFWNPKKNIFFFFTKNKKCYSFYLFIIIIIIIEFYLSLCMILWSNLQNYKNFNLKSQLKLILISLALKIILAINTNFNF